MARHVLLVPLLLLTASSSALIPSSPTSARAAEQLCLGQVPTIVGAPDEFVVEGTDGPDVIITDGALEVDALGGDDLVCVTGITSLPDTPHGSASRWARGRTSFWAAPFESLST